MVDGGHEDDEDLEAIAAVVIGNTAHNISIIVVDQVLRHIIHLVIALLHELHILDVAGIRRQTQLQFVLSRLLIYPVDLLAFALPLERIL